MSKEVLRGTRDLLAKPNGWIINTAYRHNDDGTDAFCLLGAMREASSELKESGINQAFIILGEVLKRRHAMGTLPEPRYAAGGMPPYSWEYHFKKMEEGYKLNPYGEHCSGLLAQFNNSTSQAEVVQLLDEALMLEGDDPPRLPSEEPTDPVVIPPQPEDPDDTEDEDDEDDLEDDEEDEDDREEESVLEYA